MGGQHPDAVFLHGTKKFFIAALNICHFSRQTKLLQNIRKPDAAAALQDILQFMIREFHRIIGEAVCLRIDGASINSDRFFFVE